MVKPFNFKLYLTGIFSCAGFGILVGTLSAFIIFHPNKDTSLDMLIFFIVTMMVVGSGFGVLGIYIKPMKDWIEQSSPNQNSGMQ